MAEQIKINKKCINDPLYTPVERFLKERIKRLEAEGPADELALAKERYTGLVAGDFVIENPVAFPDGITRVCFTARKTGFARVDVDITRVQMKDILEDFAVPIVEIEDLDNLKAYAKANKTDHALLWCKWLDNYGVMLSQEEAKTINGPMAAFGELFFNEYKTERESLTFIDYDTLESGTVTITDASFGTGVYPLFIYELVLDEANVPGITSNLPESITTQRGKDFSIPNTYWFNTTIDITHEAQIDISTGSGYTIPKRSEDGNFILGDTIYGSSEKDITDEIFVRVTYMWNNRPVKKTFTIKVLIEKDNSFDLTFVIDPETITAPSGSEVQTKITAFYKGTKVKITVPPSVMQQQGDFGAMKYVETDADDAMIYSGTLSTRFPNTVEQVGALYSAEFTYDTGTGVTTKAPAYVNVILTRPESAPKFEIRAFPTVIRGHKGDTGSLPVGAFFNNEPIPATDLQIKLGVKGEKGLIEYTEIEEDIIDYVVLKDANKPGAEIDDTYDQEFRWIAPTGVRYTIKRTVRVIIAQVSTVELLPVYVDPRVVYKYQFGGYPFKLLVNGEDVTALVDNYRFVDKEGYLITRKEDPRQWFVIKTPAKDEQPADITVPFYFRYTIDGNYRNFTFNQNFKVIPWTQDPGTDPGEDEGINTDTVAVPSSAKIDGLSDDTGFFEFQVWHLEEDITSTAVVMPERLKPPKGIRFDRFVYIADKNVIRANYTKLEPTNEKGKVYIQRAGIEKPEPTDIALVHVSTDVQQSRAIRVKDYTKDTKVEVAGSPAVADIYLTFAGKRVSLLDPNLSYKRYDKTDIRIVEVQENGLQVVNNTWRYIGETRYYSVDLEYTYIDPEDIKNVTKATLNLPVATVYPKMELTGETKEPIKAAIWDKGTLPLVLMAGTTNWNGAIQSIKPIGPNSKYVSFSNLNWEVIWAEKEEVTITIPLEINWEVGDVKNQKFTTDVVFTLAPWDQITFGGDWDPKEIIANSRDDGKITANFVYKGKPANNDVILDKALSTIPETFIMGVSSVVEGEGVVVGYKTTRGGDYLMTLVYRHVPSGLTITAPIETKITWPKELNLVSIDKDIKGYYEDTVEFKLVYNFYGTPIALTSKDVKVTSVSGDGNPVELKEIDEDTLTYLLAKGGEKDTDYNYDVVITVNYTDSLGKVWTNTNTVPATIRISDVLIGSNPSFNVKVWDRGVVGIKLVDERGRDVPISSLEPRGTNPYIAFTQPDKWYVTSGSLTGSVNTALRLTASYSMAGINYTMETESDFVIAKYDGLKLVVTEKVEEISGKAGTPGVMKFRFKYAGDPITGMLIDTARSVIPKNIVLGDITPDGDVPYTLVGQAVDTLKLAFIRPNATTPPVLNDDYVVQTVKVTTTSSDEVFTLEPVTEAISIPWMETATIPLVLKYGEYTIPANTPGLKYELVDSEKTHGITIVGPTGQGLTVRATRSGVSESSTVYPEDFKVTYEVGAPAPKEATWHNKITITMGKATINNNDPVRGAIWDVGTFTQNVKMGDKVLPTVDKYQLMDEDNKWIEFTSPRSWEIINADPTTSTKKIPIRLFYRVDTVQELQTLDFEASFVITGSSNTVRFTCTTSPSLLEGAVGKESKVIVKPIYKGKEVGNRATFKPELSKFPKQVKLVNTAINGVNFELTFEGIEPGLADIELVFWSPDAGTNPLDRDIWKGTVKAKIMGELGVEIGDRDNLLVGKDADTGTYKLQILFGGIPIDTKQEIINGPLKITVEKGEGSSPNAGVFNITDYTSDGLVFLLKGVVAPGREVEVSDFLNITYTYGGEQYTRRVEIPQQYTSAAVKVVPRSPVACKMFDTSKSLGVGSITCGSVILTAGSLPPPAESGWLNSEIKEETPNGYITVTVRSYSVVNADTTAKKLTVTMLYRGRYRNWEWVGEAPVEFDIEPWDQKTLTAAWMRNSSNVVKLVGDKFNFYTQLTYKGQVAFTTQDCIDYLETDLKDAIDITGISQDSDQGQTFSKYSAEAIGPYEGVIKLIFRVPGGAKPGVEFVDWVSLDMNANIKETPLIISGWNASLAGGNGDTGNMPVKVNLNGATIPPSSTDLKYTLEPNDVIKLTGGDQNNYQYEVIAPMDMELGQKQIKIKFEYKDPKTGKTHYGEYVQPFNLKLPSDYPVVVQSTWKDVKLWDKGFSPNVVTAGGKVITDQCKLGAWDKGPAELPLYDGNPENYWYQIVQVNPSNAAHASQNYTIIAPFRGGEVTLQATAQWNLLPNANQKWLWGTGSPNPFELGDGKETVLRFKLLYRNSPWTKLTLDEAAGSFGDYFAVLSVVADGDDMVVTIKGKDKFYNNFNFYWQLDSYDGTNDAQQRTSINMRAYAAPVVVPGVDTKFAIFQKFTIPLRITSNGVDITNQCAWYAVSDPRLAIASGAVPAAGPQGQVIGCPEADELVDVEFTILLPGSVGGGLIKPVVPCTFLAWDQKQFWGAERAGNGLIRDPEEGLILSVPFNPSSPDGFFGINAVVFNKDTVTPANANQYSSCTSLKNTGGLLEFRSGSGGANGVTVGYRTLKAGKQKGFVPIQYNGQHSEAEPNGYPKGTEGKNLDTMPITWDIFEDVIKFKEGFTPETIVIEQNTSTIQVPCELAYGRADVSISAQTKIVLSNNAAVINLWGDGNQNQNWGPTFFRCAPVWMNTGKSDVTTFFTVKVTYTIPGTSTTRVFEYDQRITFKGDPNGTDPVLEIYDVTEPTIEVWRPNTVFPFKFKVDGKDLPVSALTMKNISTASDYVEAGPDFINGYWAVAGKPTSMETEVRFKFTVKDLARTWAVEQNVKMTIKPYDGNELVLVLNTNIPNGYLPIGSAGPADGIFGARFRGVPVATNTLKYDSGNSELTAVTASEVGQVWTGDVWGYGPRVRFVQPNPNVGGAFKQKLAFKYDDGKGNTATAEYILDTAVWGNDIYKYWLDYPTTSIEGKFGDTVRLEGRLRQGADIVAMNNAVNNITFNPTIIQLATGEVSTSAGRNWVDVKFATEIPDLVKETPVVWRIFNAARVANGSRITSDVSTSVNVIQHTGLPQPEAVDITPISVKLHEKGTLPFRIVYKEEDVTDKITGLTISDNDYIVVDADNNLHGWECVKANLANTELLVTFNPVVTIDGIPYTVRAPVTITVLGNNGKVITVETQPNYVFGIDTEGYITITGDYSGDKLAGNISIDIAKSDGKGIITFESSSADADGNLAVKINAVKTGKSKVSIRVKSAHDTGNENVNSDFAIVETDVMVLPLELEPIERFETSGTGDFFHPVQLGQGTEVIGISVSNNDPGMIITILDNPDVAIDSMTAKSITYRFTKNLDKETTHNFKLKFTYKGLSEYIADITLTQEASPTEPFVTDIKQIDAEYGLSYQVPFKVIAPR